MKQTLKRKPYIVKDIGTSLDMTVGEKTISFYNKYFIFKKIRIVDTNVGESISDVSVKAQQTIIKDDSSINSSKNSSKVSKTKNKSRKRKGTKLKLVPKKTEKD